MTGKQGGNMQEKQCFLQKMEKIPGRMLCRGGLVDFCQAGRTIMRWISPSSLKSWMVAMARMW